MSALTEVSPGNWVDTRNPLRVVSRVCHLTCSIGDLTTGESVYEIGSAHPGPYHVIEVLAWMNGYCETPVRELYYDTEIARARELQIVRIIETAIKRKTP